MPFEIGVVCGRCDRHSVLGTSACECGNSLALRQELKPAPAPAPAPALASASAIPPLSPLFDKGDLKPRRPVAGSVAPDSVRTGRPQGGKTALSSSVAVDGAPSSARIAPRAPSEPA